MEIILENFRSFVKRQSIPITPLTFLVGENSSGKSTFLAALSAVEHRLFQTYYPVFYTPPYDLGNFDTISTYNAKSKKRAKYFSLGYKSSDIREETSIGTFKEESGRPVLHQIKTYTKGNKIFVDLNGRGITVEVSSPRLPDKLLLLPDDLHDIFYPAQVKLYDSIWYQSLLRYIAYRVTLEIDPKNKSIKDRSYSAYRFYQGDSGIDSSNIYELLLDSSINFQPDIAIAPVRTKPLRTYDEINDVHTPEGIHIPSLLSRILTKKDERTKILVNTLKSFGQKSGLFKNVKIKTLGERPSDPFQIFVDLSDGSEANIVDVGYGVNQVLPVVVESILAPENRRITMQQPEVHLHPRAQAALGSFMVDLVQKHKKQFVVETHSDYIVDRVRREVAEGRIDKDKVSILFFEKPGFETTVHVLKLDKQGNVLNAPPSYREFFLEEQMNLLMA